MIDGTEIKLSDAWIAKPYGDVAFAYLGEMFHFSYRLLDETNLVLKVELK